MFIALALTAAAWSSSRAAPVVDFDLSDTARWVLVDDEKGIGGRWVSTVLLGDGRTVVAVYLWNGVGRSDSGIRLRRSTDGGASWGEPIQGPRGWNGTEGGSVVGREPLSVHVASDVKGVERLVIWAGGSGGSDTARFAVSEDGGITWADFKSAADGLPASERWAGDVAAMESTAGEELAWYSGIDEAPSKGKPVPELGLFQVESGDGGLTWGHPARVLMYEPDVLGAFATVHSEDRRTIAMLFSLNERSLRSHVAATLDGGKTWTKPEELPHDLSGRSYQAMYGPNHRLLIGFVELPEVRQAVRREEIIPSVWVGTFEDLQKGREGLYKVHLSMKGLVRDHPSPSMVMLADGTILSTQFVRRDRGQDSAIVCVRFTLAELDAAAGIKGEEPPAEGVK